MNGDQQLISWVAVIGLVIGVMLVYRTTIKAIIFGAGPSGVGAATGEPPGITSGTGGLGVAGPLTSYTVPTSPPPLSSLQGIAA